jgi:Holliday junction DNA helicase RuvA
MIAFLKGRLIEALPTQICVEVEGVGYEVLIPLSSFEALPAIGDELRILTQLIVREDSHTLYGFATPAERELFQLLIGTVTGVGPKLALKILSGMTPTAFRGAVARGDVRSLSQISGVGRKTAERIVVELKDRLGIEAASQAGGPAGPAGVMDQVLADAVAALVVLGFKQSEALDAARATQAALGSDATVEQIVHASLRHGGR